MGYLLRIECISKTRTKLPKETRKKSILKRCAFRGLLVPTVQGVCKTRTGYLRMADADGKMRMEKCEWKKMRITKKVRRKKREMRMAKKNK